MKSLPYSSFLKPALLIAPLVLCFASSTIAQSGGNELLSPGPVKPGNLAYRTQLPQGYLKVYSATDEFNDGDAWYFPHSSYAIYMIDGKLFKNVKNKRSPDDEIPEVVALPVGTYAVVARSQGGGNVRILVVIKEDQETVLDLDLWEKKAERRLAYR
jgi:hypothetical protein